jgi:hypothetical protein
MRAIGRTSVVARSSKQYFKQYEFFVADAGNAK